MRPPHTCHPVHPSVEVLVPGLLTSCHASSWVSAAAGHFVWVFRTGSGSTSLLDMCSASGGGPLGQLTLFQPCFHVKPSYTVETPPQLNSRMQRPSFQDSGRHLGSSACSSPTVIQEHQLEADSTTTWHELHHAMYSALLIMMLAACSVHCAMEGGLHSHCQQVPPVHLCKGMPRSQLPMQCCHSLWPGGPWVWHTLTVPSSLPPLGTECESLLRL